MYVITHEPNVWSIRLSTVPTLSNCCRGGMLFPCTRGGFLALNWRASVYSEKVRWFYPESWMVLMDYFQWKNKVSSQYYLIRGHSYPCTDYIWVGLLQGTFDNCFISPVLQFRPNTLSANLQYHHKHSNTSLCLLKSVVLEWYNSA